MRKRNFAKSEAMWEVDIDGSIVHTDTLVRFIPKHGSWKVEPGSVTLARISGLSLDRRTLYMLELECNLWAYDREIPSVKRVA